MVCLLRPVDLAPMINGEDRDDSGPVIGLVDDPVVTSVGAVFSFELESQPVPDVSGRFRGLVDRVLIFSTLLTAGTATPQVRSRRAG